MHIDWKGSLALSAVLAASAILWILARGGEATAGLAPAAALGEGSRQRDAVQSSAPPAVELVREPVVAGESGGPEAPNETEGRVPAEPQLDSESAIELQEQPPEPGVRTRGVFGPAGPGGGLIAGRVTDESGTPETGHVHLVLPGGSGSLGMSTGGGGPTGSFEFNGLPAGEYVIRGSTKDGRIGLARNLLLAKGQRLEGLEIPVAPGAKVTLSLTGDYESLRCALLSDGVIFSDFTLRRRKPHTVAVPAGPLLAQVYRHEAGRKLLGERTLWIKVGEAPVIAFEVRK